MLPAVSTARIRTTWKPSPKPVNRRGEVQRLNGEPSREHWNVARSEAENVNRALRVRVRGRGPDRILVCGAVLSGTAAGGAGGGGGAAGGGAGGGVGGTGGAGGGGGGGG